jgi:hypothetical protein
MPPGLALFGKGKGRCAMTLSDWLWKLMGIRKFYHWFWIDPASIRLRHLQRRWDAEEMSVDDLRNIFAISIDGYNQTFNIPFSVDPKFLIQAFHYENKSGKDGNVVDDGKIMGSHVYFNHNVISTDAII